MTFASAEPRVMDLSGFRERSAARARVLEVMEATRLHKLKCVGPSEAYATRGALPPSRLIESQAVDRRRQARAAAFGTGRIWTCRWVCR
jgi:hypothetical protein